MKNKFIAPTLAAVAILLALGAMSRGCSQIEKPLHREINGIYYWKTSLALSEHDVEFLKSHAVGRMYLRMFDVVYEPEQMGVAVPNATIKIPVNSADKLTNDLADVEIVPVVYITLDALKAMQGKEDKLADNIVTRINNMFAYNKLPPFDEIQLDCDWTASTRQSFFKLCTRAKDCLKAKGNNDIRLSSTIRLHQLGSDPPPVDNGVLMVYNTGNFSDPNTGNSILDPIDVEPYIKHLDNYPLHLDIAYPAYSWQLLFRNRKFMGLTGDLNLNDTACFSRQGENLYKAKQNIPLNQRMLYKGDIVRREDISPATLTKVKTMIEKHLGAKPHSNILYHLDTKNLSKFTHDEINQIYSVGK